MERCAQCIVKLKKKVREHVKNHAIYGKINVLLHIYSKLKDISIYIYSYQTINSGSFWKGDTAFLVYNILICFLVCFIARRYFCLGGGSFILSFDLALSFS